MINKNVIIRDDASQPDFTDRWLIEGNKYTYYVTIVDPIGNESKPSESVEIFLKDETPPTAPKNLSTGAFNGGIALSWNMSAELDAAGYNVFRSVGLDREFKKINTDIVKPGTPYYFDSTASSSQQYFYAVSSIDTAGNESRQSNPIRAYLKDNVAPDPPSNFSYKIENSMIVLKWGESEAKDLRGYFLYRGEKENVVPRIINAPTMTTTFIDSGYKKDGFAFGGKFIYKLTSVDSSQNESEKITLIVYAPDVKAPEPPLNFNVKNFKGRYVELYCGGSPSLDSDIYTIFKSTEEKKDKKLVEFSKTPFVYKDTSVIKGKVYIYYASVIDTSGNKSNSTKKDSIFFRDFSPPPKPRYVNAKVVGSKVVIEWNRAIDFDFAGYNVYRSDYPTGTFIKLNDKPIAETKYIDATGSEKNYYRIRAVDTSGNESKFHKTVQVRNNK